ncbi:hypothetical protein WN48_00916 [Eufriesea mexicana]|uniref:Uncharacterized protein n=1 Tax=Eufriesea mexicana TaxID=516756 RepID=A0A310SMF9_9HYME|nr:hypothetical protein WN48_00916 [Eufriesea mexicana]
MARRMTDVNCKPSDWLKGMCACAAATTAHSPASRRTFVFLALRRLFGKYPRSRRSTASIRE